jgi:hypothetical protein
MRRIDIRLKGMKNTVTCSVTPSVSCTANVVPSSLIIHPDNGGNTFLRNVGSFKSYTLVTYHIVSSSPILVTKIIEVICFSETSVLTRATRRHIPEDGILHSHRRENLIPYIALTGWAL